jgi:hypothetical protein
LDLVFLTRGRAFGVKAAALANREEEIVVIAVLSNERSFLAYRLDGSGFGGA